MISVEFLRDLGFLILSETREAYLIQVQIKRNLITFSVGPNSLCYLSNPYQNLQKYSIKIMAALSEIKVPPAM